MAAKPGSVSLEATVAATGDPVHVTLTVADTPPEVTIPADPPLPAIGTRRLSGMMSP